MNFLSFVELQFYIVILYFKGEDLYFCLKNEHTFCLYINKYIGIVLFVWWSKRKKLRLLSVFATTVTNISRVCVCFKKVQNIIVSVFSLVFEKGRKRGSKVKNKLFT